MNREDLFTLIRGFGYTTSGQTSEIVDAILDVAPAAQVAVPEDHGQLVVSTAVEANRAMVCVAIKKGGVTTVLYCQTHAANGDSVGVAELDRELAAAPAPVLLAAGGDAAQIITQAQIDYIGEQWDGCIYDAPGMIIDIGEAIRAELAKLNVAALNKQEPTA